MNCFDNFAPDQSAAAPQQPFSNNSPNALGHEVVLLRGMRVVGGRATSAWQEYVRQGAPETANVVCAHQPIRFESKQYFNCPVRRT